MTDSKMVRATRRENVRATGPSPLPPYPHTKPSGIDWLGDIPTHWQVAAIRRYCQIFAGATPSRFVSEYWNGGTIPWLSSGDVNYRYIKKATQFITEEGFRNSSTKWVKPKSLVIALAGQGRTKGMVATVEFKTTCNQSLAAIEPRSDKSDYRFLAFYLESQYKNIRSLVGDGLRDGLNLEHIKSIPTPLPPPAEQAAIVRYLDDADTRIRRVIRAREKQLALLTEHKQALIERVVTGQIDVRHCTGDRAVAPTKYPAYRPSGIDWLGDVPSHWEVRRLGSLGKLSKGNGGTKADNVSTGVPCIRYGELYTKYRFFIETAYSFISPERTSDYTSIEYGDVLFAGSGETIEEIGKSAVNLMRGKVVCGGDVLIFKPSERFNPRFLGYVSDCPQSVSQKSSIGRGFTVVHIYGDKLKNLWIAIPPIAEQEAIVCYLDAQTGKIERATAAIRREIDLLKEYRTRLIADVVTGKVDVRAMM